MNREHYMRIISGDAGGITASAARAALSAASGFYAVGYKAKRAMYALGLARPRSVGARVISIGNITAGGAGKTPATIYFARKYSAEGLRVAVVSRGYGRATHMDLPLAVSDGGEILLSPEESGDEPYLIAKKVSGVPVVVCAKRVKGAEFAIERYGAEIILLDDGFQHASISRDEDVVVVDCTNPFGFGRLLPRGLLREPMIALERATRFLLTHADECDHEDVIRTLNQINPAAEILRSRHRPVRLTTLGGDGGETLGSIKGKKALAVSSIGNPRAFEATLESIGVDVARFLRFNDHHWYDAGDIERIRGAAREADAAYIISTEKDGVRLGLVPNAPKDTLLLEIELELLK
jgi:tetraacyldisaccharide 4'-kinase